MLNLDFFYKEPIDFELKNYLLLDYLCEIDSSYAIHNLSPYLLWTEKLISELDLFRINIKLFESEIKRDMIGITKSGIIYSSINRPEKLDEVIEIVEYSKPLLEGKLKLGYTLFKKYPQILY